MNQTTLKKYIRSLIFDRNQEEQINIQKTLNVNNTKYKKPLPLLRQSKTIKFQQKNAQIILKDPWKLKQAQLDIQIHLLNTCRQIDQIQQDDSRINLKTINYYFKEYNELIKSTIINKPIIIRNFIKSIVKLINMKLKSSNLQDFSKRNITINLQQFLLQLMQKAKKNQKWLKDQETRLQVNRLYLILFFIKYFSIFNEAEQIKISISEINQLVDGLVIIQRESLGDQGSFQLIRQIVLVCSYVIIFKDSLIRPKNFHKFIRQNQKILLPAPTQAIQANSQQINLEKYCNFLQKYSTLDYQYSKMIKDITFSCLQLQILTDVVRNHFKIICSIIQKRIFQNYQKDILSSFMASNYSQRSLPFISNLISDLVFMDNKKQFLCRCRQYLISLAQIGKEIRKVLLLAYYSGVKEHSIKLDKLLFNAMLEWNIQSEAIQYQQFGSQIFKIYYQSINQKNLRQLHIRSQKKLCRSLLILYLNQKLYKSIKQNQQSTQIYKIFNKQHFNSIGQNQISYKSNLITLTIYYQFMIKIMIQDQLKLYYINKDKSYQFKPYQNFYNCIEKLVNNQKNQKQPCIQIIYRQHNTIKNGIKQLHLNLQKSVRKNINQQYLLSIMIFLKALLQGYHLTQHWNSYMFKLATGNYSDKFVNYLINTMLIFKNKLPVILLISYAIISASNSKDNNNINYHKYILHIQNMITNNHYALLTSYSQIAIYSLLLLRQIIQNQQTKYTIQKILYKWRGLFGNLSKNICYGFSNQQKIYKEIIKNLIQSNQNSMISSSFYNQKQRVLSIFNIIQYLLTPKNQLEIFQDQIDTQYLFSSPQNQIIILPIIQIQNQQPLIMQFSFLVNSSIQVGNFIVICGSQSRYKLYIWGRKLALCYKKCQNQFLQKRLKSKTSTQSYSQQTLQLIPKSYQSTYKNLQIYQIPQIYLNKVVELKIVRDQSNLTIYVEQQLMKSIQFKQHITTIKIEVKGNILIKKVYMKFLNRQSPQEMGFSFNDHYKIYDRRVQCKIKRLLKINYCNFGKYFDYQHMFLLIRELYLTSKKNKKSKSLFHSSIAFKYGINLGLLMIKNIKNSDSLYTTNFEAFKKLIDTIFEHTPQQNPQYYLQIPSLPTDAIQPQPYYYLLQISIITKSFWLRCSVQTKQYLLDDLKQLLIQQTPLKQIQNKNVNIFIKLLNIAQLIDSNKDHLLQDSRRQQYQIQQKVILLCQNIILTHLPNQALIWKFIHFYYISQSKIKLCQKFQKFVWILIQLIKQTQFRNQNDSIRQNKRYLKRLPSKITLTSSSLHAQLVSKFIVAFPKVLELLVCSQTSLSTKIFQILTLPHLDLINQFPNLLSLLPISSVPKVVKQIFQVINYCIDQLNKDKSDSYCKMIKNSIQNLIKCKDSIKDRERQQLFSLLTQIFQIGFQKSEKKILNCLIFYQNIVTPITIKFIAQLNYQPSIQQSYQRNFVIKIFNLFFYGSKQWLIRFLTLYRKASQGFLKALLFPISYDLDSLIYTLPLYSLSVLLQYLYECSVVIENGVYTTNDDEEFCLKILQYIKYLLSKYQETMKTVSRSSILQNAFQDDQINLSVFSSMKNSSRSTRKASQQQLDIQRQYRLKYTPKQPQLYIYPKIVHQNCYQIIKCKKKNNQIEQLFYLKMQQLCNNNIIQIRGGIYFKLILIITRLMNIHRQMNFGSILQQILFRIKQNNNQNQKEIKIKITYQQELSPQKRYQSPFKKNKNQVPTKSPRNQAISRAVSDFPQVSRQNYDRNPIAIRIKSLQCSHQYYFKNIDKPMQKIKMSKQQYQKSNKQNDLSPYLIDFLLLKIAIYLQQNGCIIGHNINYSKLFLKCLKNYPMISESVKQKNMEIGMIDDYQKFSQGFNQYRNNRNGKDLMSSINLLQYSNIPKKSQILQNNDQHNFSPLNIYLKYSTPKKTMQEIKTQSKNQFSMIADKWQEHMQKLQLSNIKSKQQILQVPSPQRKIDQRKYSGQINSPLIKENNNNNQKIVKKSLIQRLDDSPNIWATQCRQKQFHRYFCPQAKQLLLIEFMYAYYIENNTLGFGKENIEIKNKMYQQCIDNHKNQVTRYLGKAQKYCYGKQKNSNKITHAIQKPLIRKVYPYTVLITPVLKIKAISFSNGARPFTQQTTKNVFTGANSVRLSQLLLESSKKLQSPQNIHSLSILSQGLDQQPQIILSQNSFQLKQIKSKQIVNQPKYFCQLVTRKGVFFCKWQLTQTQLHLTTIKQKPKYSQYPDGRFGSTHCNIIAKDNKQYHIKLNQIYQIFSRKYNQVMNNSIQIFMKTGKSFFIVFYKQTNTKQFYKQIRKKKILKQYQIIQNNQQQFQNRKYTQKWVDNQLSNFNYLMLINKYSGRSYSDLNQYYIFPWVFNDYKSKQLNLKNWSIYRDLSKPIGALNPSKLAKYQQKLENIKKFVNKKSQEYLYGSHYSTSLFLYYYMIRIQPFTTLHRQIQSGNFDAADRLFNSIQQMWDCLMSQSNTSDIKQSIPQFYYFSTFLKNCNNIDFGVRQSGVKVGDVILPKWANSADDFIIKMRAALESDYVSANLPQWINLIFGKYQRSFQKHNVFHPLSYNQNVNLQQIPLSSLQATICHITYFGQNPIVLFPREHRTKKQPIFYRQLLKQQNQIPMNQKKKIKLQIGQKKQLQQIHNFQFSNNKYVKSISSNDPLIKFQIVTLKLNTQILQQYYFDMEYQDFKTFMLKIQNKQPQIQNRSKSKSFNPIYNLSNNQNKTKRITRASTQKQKIIQKQIQNQQQNLIKQIGIDYSYTQTICNQVNIVLYGQCGLRIINWQKAIIWQYQSVNQQISNCYLDNFLLIFATSSGKCHMLDLITKKRKLLYNFQKKTFKLQMRIYAGKRKLQNNQTQQKINKQSKNSQDVKKYSNNSVILYKVVLVGDLRKFVCLEFLHCIGDDHS